MASRYPAAAATQMVQDQGGVKAIMVWNPFVMQVLESRSDAKRMFDSSAIPGEIVDMVVVGQDSLAKPGGPEFARALAVAFYEICDMMATPATSEQTLVDLGEKFSNLDADAMRAVCEQTLFYKSPREAMKLMRGPELKATMERVMVFC